MTVYHINKGIGPSSSGIEYAQKYRFDLVKDFPEKQYFVFCDYIYSNYTRFTDNIGIDRTDTLNAYKFLAGQENHPSSYSADDFAAAISPDFTREQENERAVNFRKDSVLYKAWLIPELGEKIVDRVDTIVSGRLLQVAHYSDRLTNIDFYNGKEVFCRYFYNEAGDLSMRQFLHEGKIILTLLDDLVLQGTSEFYDEFFRRLNFSSQDLVIIDRNTDIGAELLRHKNGAKYAVVVHAEHFSARMTDENWVLWNNYYEYVFTNYQFIDYFIVSTDKQKERLSAQFGIYGHPDSKILTIPVGTVAALSDGSQVEANKYKFLTASRLANEKHIDVLVKAVAEAKKSLPELEFHIYGAGGLQSNLSDLIKQLEASDFIKMEGHQKMTAELYAKYGGYLTASGSEGFGLTLLEAVGACLPIIGLDVDYGNSEFIKEGVNGYLLERADEEKQVQLFAEAIVKMVNELDYSAAIRFDQEKAKPYLSENVSRDWRNFYDLCLNESS
ncbi:MAG: glycosyltransferase [Streptococcaceae bacterium]|nr:glycosyltransferase [Streptococcaceae bacterium]